MQDILLGRFLFTHLRQQGVRHCFGIPGDYILPLYGALEGVDGIEPVVATHEPCAAFSADAYARMTGLGVLLVTYGVGGFNALNGVAGAYAEMSPVVVVTGGPPRGSARGGDLFTPARHHVVHHASDQLDVYRHVTDLAVRLESEERAASQIREVVAHARRTQLPVYLEIPTDLMSATIPVPPALEVEDRQAEIAVGEDLDRAAALFAERIAAAREPVLLVGVEVSRFRLEDEVRRLMEARGLPAVTTVLGKGTLDEHQPGVLGVYAGVMTPDPAVRALVEGSDLVVLLGAKVTDVDCGAFTADLKRERMLVAKSGWVGDGHMRFAAPIPFASFVRALSRRLVRRDSPPAWLERSPMDFAGSESLMDRYLAVIGAFLDESHVVVADTGDACYGSLFLRTRRQRGYLAPTFYNTMGFAVPAALGVQLADPGCRPLVLVGDGAFQMTGLELSNAVRRRLDPIVVLFNNGGFGMQRIFLDGPFNDHAVWSYTRAVDLLGGGRAWRVTEAAALRHALEEARAYRDGPALIEAVLPRGVISTGLRVMGEALRRERTGVCPLAPDGAEPCTHQSRCEYCRAAIWRP